MKITAASSFWRKGKHINNSIRGFIAAAVVSAFLGSTAQAQSPDDKNLAASIDKTAAAAVAAGESPGLEVAVVKDGRAILVKSYGSANLEQHVPVSNNSVFRIGSVTKQFTAVALLLLAEEGKVSLQDKLSKYYPNFPRANDITLDEMLHHTSGIYNYTSAPNFTVDGMIHRSTDEMVEFIGKLPKTQDFEPGTNWSYSNSAYFILGGVVEKAAGAPLAKVFKTRFFTPLGMSHSALDDETEIVSGRASGYSGTAPGKFTCHRPCHLECGAFWRQDSQACFARGDADARQAQQRRELWHGHGENDGGGRGTGSRSVCQKGIRIRAVFVAR
jgi:D-alanyl-D-alanine carboxypeptidase